MTTVKKALLGVATASLLITGVATPHANASILSDPVKAGDGFYTTSPATAGMPAIGNWVFPSFICTITAIPKKGLAITAAHCFDEVGQPLWTPLGKKIGVVFGIDKSHDIAMVALSPGVTYQTTPIAKNTYLKVGEKVSKVGTITNRTVGDVTSNLKKFISRNDKEYLLGLYTKPIRNNVYDAYFTNLCAKQGDSGAPVYNQHGKVVGILSSSNAHKTECGEGTITAVVHLGKALESYKKTHAR